MKKKNPINIEQFLPIIYTKRVGGIISIIYHPTKYAHNALQADIRTPI